MLDATSHLQKVETSMKHSVEYCLEGRVWSIGTYCSSGFNVLDGANSQSKTHRQSSTSRPWRTASYLFVCTIRHLSPLPGPRHTSLFVIDSDLRFIPVCERRREIHLPQGARCYQSWPAILTSLIPYYTAILHFSLPAVRFQHIEMVHIIALKRSPFMVETKFISISL